MPNCFSLTRRSAPSSGPVPLVKIDQEMCAAFGVPCDPVHWFLAWHDIIGLGLAMGRNWDELRDRYRGYLNEHWAQEGESHAHDACFYLCLLKVLDWLQDNFAYDAWAEIGRR